MDSDDDIQPLIYNDIVISESQSSSPSSQPLNTDPDFEQIAYGYRVSQWRRALVHVLSVLACGIPFLVFHWCPTWYLYATSVRCGFSIADKVLVIETYQKKCKSFFIHKIWHKNIADTSGLLNEGFQDECEKDRGPPETAEDLHTPLHLDDGTTLNVQSYRFFVHKKQCIVWEGARAQWAALAGVERGATCAQLTARAARPPAQSRRRRMLNIYGLNEIKVPVQSILTLTLLEVFNPFYVFQLFTIAVWLAEPYYYYCFAIVLMSTFGVASSVIQTKRNQESLRATVEANERVVLWDGSGRGAGEAGVPVDSRDVAPGDVVVLPARPATLTFDAVLITGTAIVNESMLTGESVPVTKTALLRVDRPFDLKEHSHSVLFCGTTVIQTRYYNHEPVKALVLRTGYLTSKGQLVRSILYPAPADFKFDRDSYRFIGILAIISLAGLAYTVALKTYRALTPGDIAIKALDIITIVVPPALPAAMTVGRLYAVARLRRGRVSCLNTRAVNVSGSIDCFCFDKTGTLTEDGLDMWGVVPVSAATTPPRLGKPVRDPAALNDLHDLKMGMAACHSLTLLDGHIAGDPLDVKMFESTGWLLEEPDVPETANYELLTPTIVKPRRNANINVDDIHLPLEVGIVQQQQFVSSLQRSAVVTRVLGEDVLRVYCKGAPETLRALCLPRTVPENLNEVLSQYAEQGYRVIGMATRMMEVSLKQLAKMHREELECELEFVGLVILENRLKAATAPIIRELKEAAIHVAMITGDNVHTAVSVAKECGILESGERVVTISVDDGHGRGHGRGHGDTPVLYCESTLHGVPVGGRTALPRGDGARGEDSGRGSWRSAPDAEAPRPSPPNYKIVMTGAVWPVLLEHYPHMVGPVVSRGAVFARMTADQKQRLIQEYQALGYYVGAQETFESNFFHPKGQRNDQQLRFFELDPEDFEPEADHHQPQQRDVLPLNLGHHVHLNNYNRSQDLTDEDANLGFVFGHFFVDCNLRWLQFQILWHFQIGMCGDGANDCGALRAAHTGVSLSELESSVAAPFTAQHPDIVCVSRVLREGRAALATSFGVFKFMIAYSLTEFLSVAFLYYFDSNLTDFQFLYIDVALIVNFAFFFGMTEAYEGKLCNVPPLTSLLGFVPLLSLVGQMTLIVVAQFLSYYALTYFPWYTRHLYEGDEANYCWENYAIFTVSMFQYIIMPIVFSHGSPYRKSVITNKQLMISIIVMMGISIYITVAPPIWLSNFLELKMPLNSLMSYIVLALAAFNFVLALFFERVIIQYMMERKEMIPKFLKEKKVRKTPYLMLKRQLSDTDYLDSDSILRFDKETTVSDSSSGLS